MFIADLHIHSKYSRATSRECVPEMLELWARRKGLDLIGTGDFTHPAWREELKEKLVPSEEGLYTLKEDFRKPEDIAGGGSKPRFLMSGEISSIYKKNGKVRKIHNLILLPSLEAAEALSHRLEAIGNLHSDGRPILGLDSRDLLEIALEVEPEVIFIPAHIWTPHFSVFGAYSGFDDIRECFEDLTGHIHALETGLSSDPPMNWRLSALDTFTLVSNSDAHSPANLAREANIFDTDISYPHISRALENRNTKEFYGTIEFFPEEGKYHYDGHRNCKVCLKPSETIAASGVCPVCGGRITVGVLHRAEALADRSEGFVPAEAKPFESLIPLHEVIASSMGLSSTSVKVKEKYENLIHNLGPELFILREAPLEDIEHKAGPLLAEGIRRLRSGRVEIQPGYDGEYGKIKIIDKSEIERLSGQICLFSQEKDEIQPKAKSIPDKRVPADIQTPGKDICLTQVSDSNMPYGLNPEQWEAVCALEPAVAVIAGPGTGKTKTLVSRITYLIEKCGVLPSRITAVTFTNKAAGEMRSRLGRSLNIGTFHSICLKMLQKNSKNPITVIDEHNALSIVEDILKDLGLKNSPRDVLRGISFIKNGALPADENTEVPPGVYGLYCTQLKQYGVLDYDDILLNILEYYENKNVPGSFSHLLVDEFQDINAVQYRLIKAWSKNSESIFVIGDPEQSIYGFRGSDPRCFQKFFEDFPHARKVKLTRNYRSTPEIILCAQELLLNESEGYVPLEASRKSGAKVRLLEADSAFSEAIFVAKEVNKMVGGIDMLEAQAVPAARGFSDIAVLYRTNRQAQVLEQCLLKEGIPYVVAGRDEFLNDPHVRNAIAFFRFLLNPEDLISLKLYLKKTGSLPAHLIKKILASYAAAEKSISSLAGILEQIEPAYAESSHKSIELLRKYEPLVSKKKPQALVEAWINDNALSELKCMEMLLNTSVMYDKMTSFMHNLVLGRESDILRKGAGKYSPDSVSLMTLHGAKGLEFPVVFLCGVTDGLIPFRSHSGDCNLEEERRLFYVGMTRAKEELLLLTSGTPSPFLGHLPEELLIKGLASVRKQAPEYEQLSLF
ncbi:MAG: UvrD-helicase domain-containing protein [Clostridiaceae bacterium]|nr:UvrD-helicase domain-containing protein [Clostridiaceae bacterium]